MKETNMEHYRGEIEAIVNAVYCEFVPAVVDGRPVPYDNSVSCQQCEFNDHDGTNECSVSFIKWLMSEYKEEPVLTAREKHFVELVREGWIARDEKYNTLYWYSDKPTKDANKWQGACFTWQLNAQPVIHLFPFITWEDEEPWAVADLRKLKVKGGERNNDERTEEETRSQTND